MKYRPEIDGLRALAVIPVILFHAGFDWFGGGFIGVDVFFVISGYLITTIIITEMAEGRFSILNFYERRARRILPALFVVMAASLPFAWWWLTPNDLLMFGNSLLSVSLFSSNILFWAESGYFDTAAELKPLLHTWSLAVEEQYYIVFPILLMLTWKLGVRWILLILLSLFFLSLGVAQWGTYHAASAAFYFLPTRAWELLVGVFVAFYLKYRTHVKSRATNQLVSLLGFGMIVFSIFAYDKTTPFPGLYATVPTVGTGLLILCAVPGTFVYRMLSQKPIVGIGLISYSAYLWHQPLLAFARHRLLGDVTEALLIGLCVASLLMAWFSWKFIEAPFRSKEKFTREVIFDGSVWGLAAFIVAGHLIGKNDNIFSDWESDVRMHECLLQGDGETQHAPHCYEDESGVLLWGDSHAAALSVGLAEHYSGKTPFTQLTQSACPPIFGLETPLRRKTCNQINQRILDDLKKSKYRKVILHASWVHHDYPMSPTELREKLIRTFDELQKIEGLQLTVIGNAPRWAFEPAQLAKFDSEYIEANGLKYYKDSRVLDIDALMLELQKKYGFSYLSPIDSVCIYSGEARYCPLISNDEFLYVDGGHLSRAGSEYVVSTLGEFFH